MNNIHIYDAMGKMVIEWIGSKTQIDISFLNNGIYSVVLATEQGILIGKFVK